MYMRDGAGPRLRVALPAMGEVGGPLEAVFAIWFGSVGARTSLMPADQRRSWRKKHLGAHRTELTCDRPTHLPVPTRTAVPRRVRVFSRAERRGQTNLRGGKARRPRWRGDQCTCLYNESLDGRRKRRIWSLQGRQPCVPDFSSGREALRALRLQIAANWMIKGCN